MDERAFKLYQKCEAMSVLTQKACNYWSLVKRIFQVPLILTSSVMCILNSFDDDKGKMRIPNVVVNGVSVLLISYQSNLKVFEKCELFKNLSNQFLKLAHDVEGKDPEELDRNTINSFIEKYDGLIESCLFEDIPKSIKLEVIKLFENKSLPLQLNGGSGLQVKDHTVHRGELCHPIEV
jgi:hypothetical protein